MLISVRYLSGITIEGDSTFANKTNRVLVSASEKYSNKSIYKTYVRMIIFFVTYYLAYIIVQKKLLLNKEENKQKLQVNELILKINIVTLIIIPATAFSVDFYRIQQTLSILNYIALSYYFIKPTPLKKINLKYLMFTGYCVAMSFINLYFLVLGNANIDTVFWPLFKNNLLL